jgi:hypothetical protein
MPDDALAQRILVDEDEPAVRMLGEIVLKELGYSVTLASIGKGALSLIKRGGLFALLFTDVIVPGGVRVGGKNLRHFLNFHEERPGYEKISLSIDCKCSIGDDAGNGRVVSKRFEFEPGVLHRYGTDLQLHNLG